MSLAVVSPRIAAATARSTTITTLTILKSSSYHYNHFPPLLRASAALSVSQNATPRHRFHTTTQRSSAHGPMAHSDLSTRKKVTINTIRRLYEKGEKISMITAHDFPSGLLADQAGVDVVLVGDSLAMVGLGMEDTNQITLDDMLHHTLAVSRGVRSAFLVADLPMGSYELSPQQALQSSISIIQKGRASSVKLEGGVELADTVRTITKIGIPVLGHIGLTPQRQGSLGGFVVQSKTAAASSKLLSDALALQDAGCWGVVLEAVPGEVASLVTQNLDIPTIGIGAGEGTSGQVLVQIDMLGNFPSGRFLPKFVKRYEDIFERSRSAIERYKDEVKSGSYPAQEHTYPSKESEIVEFKEIIKRRGEEIEASKIKRRSYE